MTGLPAQLDPALDTAIADVIAQLLESIGIDARDITLSNGPADPSSEQLLRAAITFTGDWNGALLLRCDIPSAKTLASRMGQPPGSRVEEADLVDAVAEVTNILGGNVKPLLAGHNTLGLPSVGTCGTDPLALEGHSVVSTSLLTWAQSSFLITVVHTNR